MSEEKDAAELNPDSSPGELKERKLPVVKRINNMPLFVGIGAVGIVLMVFLYVVMDRAQQQNAALNPAEAGPVEEPAKNVQKATLSYGELVSGVGDGLIPEDKPEPTATGKSESSVSPVAGSTAATASAGTTYGAAGSLPPGRLTPASQAYPGRSADPLGVNKSQGGVSNGLDKTLRNQILQTKAQKTQEAIFAGTSVDFTSVSRAGNSQSGSVAETQQRAKSALDQYREKLASMQNLVGQDGGLGGLGGGSSSSDSAFLGGGDNDWALGTMRQAGERYSIKTGGIIPAVMISGINSDLPGQVIAQVSQNIYDTASGYELLIPQGARLVGSYNSDVIFGQSRVMMRWDRLVFPDGSTLNLGGMAGADQMGYSGFKDKVNNHYWKIFGNAFMLSLISAGYQQSLPEETSSDVYQSTSAREQVAISMAENFNEVGSELIRRNLNIQPTLEIRPGYKFNVMINKDMVFKGRYTEMALRD